MTKTDVTLAILLHKFSRASQLEFLTVTQLHFRIDLCSILCNSVDRMLNADWLVVIVVFVFVLFAVHICPFASFILIYLIWKWNGRTLKAH